MTVSVTMRPDKRRAPKPRLFVRRLFRGELRAGVLEVARGCHETAVDKGGEVVRDREPDASRRLLVNVGDRLMLWGRVEPDEVALVEIVHIAQEGWNEQLAIGVLAGTVSDGRVQVMRAKPRDRQTHVDRRHGRRGMEPR